MAGFECFDKNLAGNAWAMYERWLAGGRRVAALFGWAAFIIEGSTTGARLLLAATVADVGALP